VNVLLLGPQGSGKGTQAKRIQAEYGIPHIATGEMLRAAIDAGSELGRRVKPIVESGRLVPDDLMIELIRERLGEDDAQDGFILDGFPRTVPQAEALEALLVEQEQPLDVVLRLSVDQGELVNRLTGRRTCTSCGAVFHVEHSPPQVEGTCDVCGGEIVQREDDREDVVLNRLQVYRSQTEPLEQFYWERGLLRDVEAVGEVDEISERVLKILRGYQA
jgi:adenylate kinase